MKIREVTQKAENLIEQGENAKQRQVHYQQAANSARAQLMSAYARLEAASETDEDGEPMGDVAGAQAELFAAQAFLNSAELGLADATRQLEGIDQQKLDAVQEIERYETTGEGNLTILAQLQAKQFGSNAAAFMVDLAARMNSGEQMRQQLLQSMGRKTTAKNYTSTGSSGAGIATIGSVPEGYSESKSLLGVVVHSIKNSNSPEVQKWTSRMNAISNKLYNQYSLRYGSYISSEKLKKPLSETLVYETRDLFTARGMKPGVLGYNDGQSSHVAVGTGHELQTTVHENLHQLSANGNSRGIIEQESHLFRTYRKNVQMNEAITELLTQRTLGSDYGPDYSAYSDNRDAIALIESVMGEDTIAEAYFQNKPELMRQKFEEVMGPDSWEQLSAAFDDCVSDMPFTRNSGRIRRDSLINDYMLRSNQRNGGEKPWIDQLF